MTKLAKQNRINSRPFACYSRRFASTFCLLLFLLCLPLITEAVSLYLEPNSGEYQPGETFIVDVKIDTEGECVNAVEASLVYDNDILKATDFGRGESILNLWVRNPEINQEQGLISFSGGIPGGFCGRLPGDPGPSNLLGKIIFQTPGLIVRETTPNGTPKERLYDPTGQAQNYAKIDFLDSSQALLNDGFGTPAKLSSKGATIKITEVGPLETPKKDEWQTELKEDNIPPEPFEIEIHQEPTIFEGKYFIIFSTTDKQTGIDYYQVKEGKRDWKKVESPYLLEDQNLKSIIKVKAVDKEGNEGIAEYIPSKKPFPWRTIILIVAGTGIIWWIIKKFKIK